MISEFIKSSIFTKKTRSILTVFAIALSVSLILLTISIFSQISNNIILNAQHYDILIGAEGSKTQLVFNTLMFYDKPIGNISNEYLHKLEKDERVNQSIPLGMGDYYRGFRIIGTKPEYLTNLKVRFYDGRNFDKEHEAVLGWETAKRTGLKIGDEFTGTHGIDDDHHDKYIYKVIGILEPTNTPNDKAIFTDISNIWAIHNEHCNGHVEHECHHDDHNITAILVRSNGLSESFLLAYEFSQYTGIQAINPASAIRDVLATLSTGERIALILAYVSVVLAVITLFIVMLTSSVEKRKDMAILRVLGASKKTVFGVMMAEAAVLSLLGCIVGMIMAHLSLAVIQGFLFREYGIYINPLKFTVDEFKAIFIAMILSILAGMIPSYSIYKTDATKYL